MTVAGELELLRCRGMRMGFQILEVFVPPVSVTNTDRQAIAHSLLHCLTNKMNREGNNIL